MDDGLLIEQVQGFPAIYNKNDPRFKNKVAREQAWTTIGGILGFTADDCEQRWKILRAKYGQVKREVRDTPSGSGSYTISWPHYEGMGFLDPFLVPRRTVSNMKTTVQSSSSCKQQASLSHWDSIQYMSSQETDIDTPEGSQGGSESEPFSPPSTPAPEQISDTPSNLSSFKAKMHTLKNEVKTRGSKRSAQELMCETLTTAIGDFRKKTAEEDKNGLQSWAKSLASDMLVLTTEEQIFFKKRVYELLTDVLSTKYNA